MKNDFGKISSKISQKIKLERNKKGFSQEELASRANINKNTIWKIETGQVSPNICTLEKIAHALEIEFTTLMDVSKVDL
ncbi:helix-turn-helix transcriptional regulator [bacterium]|nr:helix-turn-helix transcriptional regulator [bacterium]MBR6722586.1 helix-turn-helix transcriptional regulator [bacterium]